MSIRDVRAGVEQAAVNTKAYGMLTSEVALMTAGTYAVTRSIPATVGAFIVLAGGMGLIGRSPGLTLAASLVFGSLWGAAGAGVAWALGQEPLTIGAVFLGLLVAIGGVHMNAFTYAGDLVAQDKE